MKLSMVLIAKDEQDNVRDCFDSFWDDVDEVVFVDTGSTDETVAAVHAYAKAHPGTKLKVAHYHWKGDFAAARAYADSLATGDWLAWADLDDTVHGIPNLRKLAESANADVNAFFCSYEYALNEQGECICELWRERLVRKGAGSWIDRVHESQVIQGVVVKVDPSTARWTHRKPPFTQSDRNTKILEKWVEEEPTNPRVLANLARDYMSAGKFKEAIPFYERYLRVGGQQPQTRAQATRQLSTALCAIERFDWARELTLRAFGECPTWPDTYLTLAEIALVRCDWPTAIHFAEQVVRIGKPETLLIVNPQDYDARPRAMIATALASLGKTDEACELAEQALELAPGYMDLAAHLAEWQGTRQRDQTAAMWAQCAGMLVGYDEPLKAEKLLETVPHYAWDHPTVISARVQVRDAVEEPYQVEKITEGPRAEFLLRGLRKQVET
jgi:tetratricopeptide (TPR) repeat protein